MTDSPVVLLGVTGGIAAYKAAELLRGLQKAGMDVRVVMTDAATQFVTSMTFETLSGHPVRRDAVNELRPDSRITHVEDSIEADIMVIVPATANTLAKMANGIADNLLTSICLAFNKTIVVAPAMNTNMWEHPATQHNVNVLRDRGVFVVEPGAGELACGIYGSGRMADPDSIVAEVKLRLQVQRKRDLRGVRVLITAGGTREPIDAVRFIGNRSSGKMGFALARAAFDRGAEVELIEANVDMPAVPGVRQTLTPTAGEMHAEVMKRLPNIDILIMAAAVADYRVAEGPAGGKIGKGLDEWKIGLEATTDILCDVAAHHEGQILVGFAAEYGLEGLERARTKMERKQLDMIVFNDISRSDIGFDSDFNEVRILSRTSEVLVERAPKETIAEIILDNIAQAVRARRGELMLPA
ncbi:MAG TPA: bifunctional phosphopantothenoylcysteine decarboxylase/phosphopantothenate--cysteine ligase CoaBC [Thermoleophilia bacterium]|nr:bifunctional phosphopantothenoylcysteine decarboxylase/phosphopantothenate--cysteine ligase CoaBC [Thermoleophilia bacterium]